jgi:hypothetical protein
MKYPKREPLKFIPFRRSYNSTVFYSEYMDIIVWGFRWLEDNK